jgi:hypothetical protein
VAGADSTWHLIGAASLALALVAVIWVVVLTVQIRRLRRAQSVVLGEHGNADLIAHAAALEDQVLRSTEHWERLSEQLTTRMGGIEGAVLRVMSRNGVVRYDAYGELSGQQSCSLALLDVRGDGFVLTSIHHRDQARLYIRRIIRGKPEHRLAPEEEQALDLALHGGMIAADGSIDGVPPTPRPGVDGE